MAGSEPGQRDWPSASLFPCGTANQPAQLFILGWASLTLPSNDISVVCQRKTKLGVISHRTWRGHQDKRNLFFDWFKWLVIAVLNHWAFVPLSGATDPVFNQQSRIILEIGFVVGHQRSARAQRMGSNEPVQRIASTVRHSRAQFAVSNGS